MFRRHTSPSSSRVVNATQLGLQLFVLGAAPTESSSRPPNCDQFHAIEWMTLLFYALLYIKIFVYEN
jgi:hypothetical protein